MRFEELPADLRENIESLKHGSFTIECDVKDALEYAENLEDFKVRASGALNNLMEEIKDVMREFKHRQLTEKERDRMIDIYASGPVTYIPEKDDQLFLLDLISFYDSAEEMEAVVAKHDTDFFYSENGSVLPEWYGKGKENTLSEFDIIFHKGKPVLLLEVANAFHTEINDLLDEYFQESNGFFGDTDFVNHLKSKKIRVRSHPFEELSTEVR